MNRASVVIIAFAAVLFGCKQPPATYGTREENASSVTAPLAATTRAATDAKEGIKSADARLARLQRDAESRPAIPSADVNAVVVPARLDLASALAHIGDALQSASDAARRALDLGGRLVSMGQERDAAIKDRDAARQAEQRANVRTASIVIGGIVAFGVYELGAGLVIAGIVGAFVFALVPFAVDDVRPWLKWAIGAGCVGLFFLHEAKNKGGILAAVHDKFSTSKTPLAPKGKAP